MKKVILAVLALLISQVPALATRDGDQGYGVMVGNPTGLSAKIWMDDRWAFDGAVGVARSEFDVHVSLLRHSFNWHDGIDNKWPTFQRWLQKADIPLYFGIGPRVLFEHNEELGIRFPLGFSVLPKASNWEVFTEFAPVFRLTPSTGFNADYALGVRYYFRSIRPRVAGQE